MSAENPQQDLISFSCKSCGASYNVKPELSGREVACKQCSSPIVIPGGRRYPGENRDPLLGQVSKVSQPLPMAGKKGAPKSFQGRAHHIEAEAASALKTIACILAVVLILITSLVLTLGASPEGMLAGVGTTNRLLVAGFIGLLTTVLLIYSNTRSWLLMLLIGLVSGASMTCLPLLFTGGTSLSAEPEPWEVAGDDQDLSPNAPSEEELREIIGVKPLENERQKLLETSTTKTALGLWLRGVEERHGILIEDYVVRAMGASEESHTYPRAQGESLMVVTGIEPDLNKLSDVANALGTVKAIHSSLHIVEVSVDNSKFKSGPIEKLIDPQSPDFYRLNAIELKSIDLDRVSEAVRRLSDVEPALLRDDIAKRLAELLQSDWYEKKGDVCRALLTWADETSEVGREALKQALALHENTQEVPQEMIALCIKQGESDVIPLLHKLWQATPTQWEPWFGVVGVEAEKIMLQNFSYTSGMLRQSACRILGQIGSRNSLSALKLAATNASDSETRIIANSSIQQIEKRLARKEE